MFVAVCCSAGLFAIYGTMIAPGGPAAAGRERRRRRGSWDLAAAAGDAHVAVFVTGAVTGAMIGPELAFGGTSSCGGTGCSSGASGCGGGSGCGGSGCGGSGCGSSGCSGGSGCGGSGCGGGGCGGS